MLPNNEHRKQKTLSRFWLYSINGFILYHDLVKQIGLWAGIDGLTGLLLSIGPCGPFNSKCYLPWSIKLIPSIPVGSSLIKRLLTQTGYFPLEIISHMSSSCCTIPKLIMGNMSCTLHSISVGHFLVPIRNYSLKSPSPKLLPSWRVCNWSLTYHVPCHRIL